MQPTPFRRILVPIDFSEPSRHALEYAVQLAPKDAELELLYVIEPMPLLPAEATFVVPGANAISLEQFARRAAQQEFDAIIRDLSQRNVRATTRIEFGNAATEILRTAEHKDLVVMGTHGRTGISRVLMGSVTQKVVSRSPCPVLTVRHPSARETK